MKFHFWHWIFIFNLFLFFPVLEFNFWEIPLLDHVSILRNFENGNTNFYRCHYWSSFCCCFFQLFYHTFARDLFTYFSSIHLQHSYEQWYTQVENFINKRLCFIVNNTGRTTTTTQNAILLHRPLCPLLSVEQTMTYFIAERIYRTSLRMQNAKSIIFGI